MFSSATTKPIDLFQEEENPKNHCVEGGSESNCIVSFVEGKHFPRNCSFIDVCIKSKAVVFSRNPPKESYALIFGGVVLEDNSIMNHCFHTEQYEGTSNIDRRIVHFNTIRAPVINGKVTFRVGKQIIGPNCLLEIAFYLNGYERPWWAFFS